MKKSKKAKNKKKDGFDLRIKGIGEVDTRFPRSTGGLNSAINNIGHKVAFDSCYDGSGGPIGDDTDQIF